MTVILIETRHHSESQFTFYNVQILLFFLFEKTLFGKLFSFLDNCHTICYNIVSATTTVFVMFKTPFWSDTLRRSSALHTDKKEMWLTCGQWPAKSRLWQSQECLIACVRVQWCAKKAFPCYLSAGAIVYGRRRDIEMHFLNLHFSPPAFPKSVIVHYVIMERLG